MRIFVIVCCAIFSIGSLAAMVMDGVSWNWVMTLTFFGGGGVFFLFQDKLHEATIRKQRARLESARCVVHADHLYFPKGYYFRFGYLKDRKKLEYAIIDEIRLNTHPITARINGNEIIFLRGCQEGEMKEFARINNIRVVEPQDNWALLCHEFLDTEASAPFSENMTRLLVESGIDVAEQRSIKKRISLRMLIRTYATWEWIYYGQHDVLSELWPLTARKYWWTMDIALRKSGSKTVHSSVNPG